MMRAALLVSKGRYSTVIPEENGEKNGEENREKNRQAAWNEPFSKSPGLFNPQFHVI